MYCGDKTCAFNNKSKCRNFKIALSEQGSCMGYSPLIMPNINTVANGYVDKPEVENSIGFGG